jgi:hypothetical protein
MQLRLGTALVAGVAVVVATSGFTRPSHAPPAFARAAYLTPLTYSEDCERDARRKSACGVVHSFFRAVNSRRFATACALLGRRLSSESTGVTCPAFLDAAVPEPVPWGIRGAKRSGSRVFVLVTLGTELERWHMRKHRLFVGVERGRLRILATKLVR